MFNHVSIELDKYWEGNVSNYAALPSFASDKAIYLVLNADSQHSKGFYQYNSSKGSWLFIPANTLIGLGQHVFQGTKGEQGEQLKIEGTTFLRIDEEKDRAVYLFTFTDGSTCEIEIPIIRGNDGQNGSDGAAGKDGINGTDGLIGVDGDSVIWLGTLSNPPSDPTRNTAYKDAVSGISYIWNGGFWEVFIVDGEQGVSGLDGFDGTSGDYVEFLYSYSSVTPEGGKYTVESGFDATDLTSGWYDDLYDVEINRPDDSYLDNTIYVSKGRFRLDPLTNTWFLVNSAWSTPAAITGKGIVKGVAFKRSLGQPDKPLGGTFSNPNPTGNGGWSDGIPTGTLPLWMSTRIFTSNGGTPQQADWGEPSLVANTSDVKTEFSVDGLTDWQEPFEEAIYMRTCTSPDGGATWSCTAAVKVKGEKGDLPDVQYNGDGTYTITGQNGQVIVRDGYDSVAPTVVERTDSEGRTVYDVTVYDNQGVPQNTVTINEPLKNVDYFDGVTGDYISYIYRISTNRPSTPTGGSYSKNNEVIPNGWTDNPNYGLNDTVWVSKTKYVSHRTSNGTEYWTSTGWSTPTAFYQRGEKGDTGTNIQSVREEFAVNSSNTNPPSSGWSTTAPAPTEAKPYLWNKTTVYGDNGIVLSTSYNIAANYAKDGRGISHITSLYRQHTSGTSAPSSSAIWYSSIPSLTDAYPYLWNKETIYYDDGSTPVEIIKMIAQKGKDGEKGTVDASTIITEVEKGIDLTAGGIVFNSGGWIKSRNATTGNGVFLGHHQGNYQFWAGNNNSYIHWNGSALNLRGNVNIDGYLASGGVVSMVTGSTSTSVPASGGSKRIYMGTVNKPAGAATWALFVVVGVNNITNTGDQKDISVRVEFGSSHIVHQAAAGSWGISVSFPAGRSGLIASSIPVYVTLSGVNTSGTVSITGAGFAITESV